MSELPLSPGGHRFGFIYVPRDPNELGVGSIPGLKLELPPPSDYHLSEFMQPVKNQLSIGACTAFCGAADREAIAAQYQKKIVTLSPQFLYRIERQINGTASEGDVGSDGQTSCQALAEYGICLESDDPFNPPDYNAVLTDAQLTNAVQWKAGAHHSLFTVQDVKLCINSGFRVRIGFTVYQSFEDIGSNGMMPVPNAHKEQILGGHEILIYGYDDLIRCPGAKASGAVKVRNSWGASWGLNGDLWMAQELLVADSIIQPDLKMQHLGKPWVPLA